MKLWHSDGREAEILGDRDRQNRRIAGNIQFLMSRTERREDNFHCSSSVFSDFFAGLKSHGLVVSFRNDRKRKWHFPAYDWSQPIKWPCCGFWDIWQQPQYWELKRSQRGRHTFHTPFFACLIPSVRYIFFPSFPPTLSLFFLMTRFHICCGSWFVLSWEKVIRPWYYVEPAIQL